MVVSCGRVKLLKLSSELGPGKTDGTALACLKLGKVVRIHSCYQRRFLRSGSQSNIHLPSAVTQPSSRDRMPAASSLESEEGHTPPLAGRKYASKRRQKPMGKDVFRCWRTTQQCVSKHECRGPCRSYVFRSCCQKPWPAQTTRKVDNASCVRRNLSSTWPENGGRQAAWTVSNLMLTSIAGSAMLAVCHSATGIGE